MSDVNSSMRRGPNGQFLPGNSGGPGNPHMRAVGELRRRILEAFDSDQIIDVLDRLRLLALEGNMAAAKLFLEYTVGKPLRQPETVIEGSPGLCQIRGLEDAQKAGAKVVERMFRGEISLEASERLMRVIAFAAGLYRGTDTESDEERARRIRELIAAGERSVTGAR